MLTPERLKAFLVESITKHTTLLTEKQTKLA
jgi:hypothetical protein